jgi:dihydrofolate synthase/folylpolyglutamate synthase
LNTIAPQATDSLFTWLDYWGHVHVTGIDLGLERVIPVAEKLNVTTTSAKVITVAGTNGKVQPQQQLLRFFNKRAIKLHFINHHIFIVLMNASKFQVWKPAIKN